MHRRKLHLNSWGVHLHRLKLWRKRIAGPGPWRGDSSHGWPGSLGKAEHICLQMQRIWISKWKRFKATWEEGVAFGSSRKRGVKAPGRAHPSPASPGEGRRLVVASLAGVAGVTRSPSLCTPSESRGKGAVGPADRDAPPQKLTSQAGGRALLPQSRPW